MLFDEIDSFTVKSESSERISWSNIAAALNASAAEVRSNLFLLELGIFSIQSVKFRKVSKDYHNLKTMSNLAR